MRWDNTLSTGIEAIDDQHKKIIEYINELESALRDGNPTVVGSIIENMVDYTINHFSFEEALMEQADYEHLKEHKLVHEAFTQEMLEFRKRFAAGEDVGRELLTELLEWLITHIKRSDHDYIPAVKAVLEPSWVKQAIHRFFGTAH